MGACLLNSHPDKHGLCIQFAAYTATPMLVLLSPILLLVSFGGIYTGNFIGHAASAVLTWTLLGFLAGTIADLRKRGRWRSA